MRCSRKTGGGWHCKNTARVGFKMCEVCAAYQVKASRKWRSNPENRKKDVAGARKRRAADVQRYRAYYLRWNRTHREKKSAAQSKYYRTAKGRAAQTRGNARRSNKGQDAYLQAFLKGETIVRKLSNVG